VIERNGSVLAMLIGSSSVRPSASSTTRRTPQCPLDANAPAALVDGIQQRTAVAAKRTDSGKIEHEGLVHPRMKRLAYAVRRSRCRVDGAADATTVAS